MIVSQDIVADIRVLRVDETRIDAVSAVQFKDRFRALIDGPRRQLVLDLSSVTFLDSSGLGALVTARKYLPDGVSLHLSALQPAVSKVMTLTRMDQVFPIHADVDTACSAIRAGKAA